MGQRRKKSTSRKREDKSGAETEDTEAKDETRDGLILNTCVIEEGTAVNLETELEIGVEEEYKKEGEGNLMALGGTRFLTKEAERSGTTLVNACNGFNDLSRLERLWTVWHC